MRHRSRLSNRPLRIATGAFILNSGLGKLHAEKETYEHLHAMASGTYPFLKNVPPVPFGKALAVTECLVGTTLLAPVTSDTLAGFALSAFSGGLVGLYLKTPGMRREGSVRPTQNGIALAKDTWLVGAGLTLLMSGRAQRRRARRRARATRREQAKHGAAATA